MMQSAFPTIVVAALTYKRPEMLGALLDSLLKLERPAGWTVRFLIVDNDAEASARETVKAAADAFGGLLDYVVEPEPGIPFGRNRAMREAMDRGASLLCFIDDDGIAEPTWICELLAHRQSTGAAVIGGPVPLLPPTFPIGWWQRLLTRSVMARDAYKGRRRAAAAANGKAEFGTGNWMADLEWIAAHDMQFDTTMRFTGGTDTAFLADLQTKGGKAAWCDRAIVYDQWQADRVSARYLFTRARAQAQNTMRLQPQPALRLVILQPIRMLMGVGLIIVPVQGSASFVMGLEMIARAVGKFSSLWGRQSSLYARQSAAPADSTPYPGP